MKYFLIILSFLFFSQCAEKKKSDNKSEKKLLTKTEHVQFSEQDDGTWAMTGSIRNNNDFEISGKVNITLLDKNKNAISNFSTMVNDGNPIAAGDTGIFKYTGDKTIFAGAKGYRTNFVQGK